VTDTSEHFEIVYDPQRPLSLMSETLDALFAANEHDIIPFNARHSLILVSTQESARNSSEDDKHARRKLMALCASQASSTFAT